VAQPILVESSDSEREEGDDRRKRRRTSSDSSSSGENVIDLTDLDDHTTNGNEHGESEDDEVRFNFSGNIVRLAPFRFTENPDDDDEAKVRNMESLRDHLQRLFGRVVSGNLVGGNDSSPLPPPSPVNPDELEIIGVKESTISSTSPTFTSPRPSTPPSSTRPAKPKPPTSKPSLSPPASTPKEKGGKEGGGPMALECPICLGAMNGITATTCGHIFCLECIKKAIQVTKCCPLCKKRLTVRSIHPLYL
jgi:hypothetical protein